ncbi:MAG: hypothetical protein KKC79_07990 [Gammaproteobacteria bacterium]|nr:hypothetical protein [Gammaproteobacteria bacterium]MBU1442928.1 hypothetical protein [Gammaproteobacteria bacterium]MBU2408576.1 hypothetical protein [Gammaproteobacteria bacterium]
MKRRRILAAAASFPMLTPLARAHHGWSSFDQERPIYLEGKVVQARWQNPHAELMLEVPANLRVPADLAQRTLPKQRSDVDGPALLAKAVAPKRTERQWELELAPLTRMEAWKVAEITPGKMLSAVGFTHQGEQGDAVMRVEFLFVDGKAYGLRSNPA